MTEYWVSQKKHFCECCKVWCGGHKWQIKKHEEGRMHIEKKEAYIQNMHKREKQKQREAEDLKMEIQKIEAAAQYAMAAYSDGITNTEEDPEPEKPKEVLEKAKGPPEFLNLALGPPGGVMPELSEGEGMHSVNMQKSVIEAMVAEAKRKREAEGPKMLGNGPPKKPKPVAEGSPWLECTDPRSGAVYYYNQETKVSAWQKPEPKIDWAAPPPPPGKKPQPPPPPAKPGCVGVWQEVLPEESMWANPTELENAKEEEPALPAPPPRAGRQLQDLEVDELYREPEGLAESVNPIADLKWEMGGRKGVIADEDLETHEKEIEQKRSLMSGSATFPVNRKKASGIRKKREDD